MKTFRYRALLGIVAATLATPQISRAEDGADLCKTLVAADLFPAWNEHNADKVAGAFTPGGIYEDAALSKKNTGTEEIRKFAKFVFDVSPDFKMELTNCFIKDGHGYSEWVMSGTDVGFWKTNARFSGRGSSVMDIEGDKLSRNVDYYDLSIIMKQVGILPSSQASQSGTSITAK